jgi:hypothetical protein
VRCPDGQAGHIREVRQVKPGQARQADQAGSLTGRTYFHSVVTSRFALTNISVRGDVFVFPVTSGHTSKDCGRVQGIYPTFQSCMHADIYIDTGSGTQARTQTQQLSL